MEALRFRPCAYFVLGNATPSDISGHGQTVTVSTPSKAAALVKHAEVSRRFSNTITGSFDADVYIQGRESLAFSVCATVALVKTAAGDMSIWSTASSFDGLSYNGTVVSFSTAYTATGSATASFDVLEAGRYEIVGVHTKNKNQLYVDGEIVAEVEITDAQQADTYLNAGGTMQAGHTSSGNLFLMNGLGLFKHALSGDQVSVMYQDNLPLNQTTTKTNSGTKVGISRAYRQPYFSHAWDSEEDFNTGEFVNTRMDDGALVPFGSAGDSIVGTWVGGTPFYTETDNPTLATVIIDWSGQNVTVQTSVDGSTWASAAPNVPITTTGHNFTTTGKRLWVRVLFDSGLALEDCWLDWLRVEGYLTDTIVPTQGRTITLNYPTVAFDEQPWYLMKDKSGLYTSTSIAFGSDGSGVPVAANTIEAWLKIPGGGAPSLSWTPTNTYINGSFSSSPLTAGEWGLYHWVTTSAPSSFTITGTFILGSLRVLDSTITSGQSQAIYLAYVNNPKTVVSDGTIAGAESIIPAIAYGHDWAVLTS